ncbi:hypothetical protein [Bradyrhizobium prioriisuperbiae]|uniref:hypothetical protein n=1 Tax=Bradyrhizobium prioriisuperbiae TaxID=2854389 RepID=UPI0028EB7527|nr:hypothetical protein [Bradyrhizobium prioritasuperba]
MSISNPGPTTLAAIAIALSLINPALAATKRSAVHSGPPPFCIARGGGGEGGGGTRTDCRFYDYQTCQQAAAAGGNCVQNIDAK